MTYHAGSCHCEERSDEAISSRIVSRLAKCGNREEKALDWAEGTFRDTATEAE
jgi:hypothetical protein